MNIDGAIATVLAVVLAAGVAFLVVANWPAPPTNGNSGTLAITVPDGSIGTIKLEGTGGEGTIIKDNILYTNGPITQPPSFDRE